ncbi:MAG: DnaB-like helicase C-terminal domain-containing protein [Bacillota bacterium]|nr:DnaB-like helicase C-terminal domain-containing protein [Bacillota bacterium]
MPETDRSDLAQLAAYYHDRLTPVARSFLRRLGIDDETVHLFQIGADEPGARIGFGSQQSGPGDFCGRIIFPVRDIEDRVIDLIGYAPQAKPRYKSLSGNLGVLFNQGIIEPSDPIFVSENLLDAVVLTQQGFAAAAVPGAANFRPEMAAQFRGKEVYLVFSGNYAGRRNTVAVARLLCPVARAVYVVTLPEGTPCVAELFAAEEDAQLILTALVAQAQREHRFEDLASDARAGAAFVQEVLERREGQLQGISTGFEPLDQQLLGGVREGLYLLAGYPGLGKTTLLRQLADQVAVGAGHPVLFLSLEMSAFELWAKSIAREMEVPVVDVLTGRVEPELLRAVSSRYREAAERMWTLEGNETTTVRVLSERAMEVGNRAGSVPVVFIDGLQRLAPGGGDSGRPAVLRTPETALALKRMSRQLSCPVVATVSLNREAGSAFEALLWPELADLEHIADVLVVLRAVGSLTSPDAARAEMAQDPSRMVLEVAKNRNGTSGGIPVLFFKRHGRFAEGTHATSI